LGKQDQIWAKIFCIPKYMHSRTLMTLGYVGGKHLVSVDADNYIFALFFMDTSACASESCLR